MTYEVNGLKYNVGKGEYLLANALCEGKVEIDSPKMVKDICIDVSPQFRKLLHDLLHLTVHFLTLMLTDSSLLKFSLRINTILPRPDWEKYWMYWEASLIQSPFDPYSFDEEFYFNLAEKIVEDHQPIIAQLYKIRTVRHNTRKDLYRKVSRGKEFMDNNLCSNMLISEAAGHACLSEYHFFRLFKDVFDITPQQYLLRERLAHAQNLRGTGIFR